VPTMRKAVVTIGMVDQCFIKQGKTFRSFHIEKTPALALALLRRSRATRTHADTQLCLRILLIVREPAPKCLSEIGSKALHRDRVELHLDQGIKNRWFMHVGSPFVGPELYTKFYTLSMR